jgi:hypothetical protein
MTDCADWGNVLAPARNEATAKTATPYQVWRREVSDIHTKRYNDPYGQDPTSKMGEDYWRELFLRDLTPQQTVNPPPAPRKAGEILRTETGNGYLYSMAGANGFADVEIEVIAEHGGHGCLYGIKMPEVSIVGDSHQGPDSRCDFYDFCKVLNQIMVDYSMDRRIYKAGPVEDLLRSLQEV